MIPFQLTGDDAKQDSPFKTIIAGALGKVIILDVAPTSTTNTVPEKELAYFNNKLYMTIEGTLKEWSVSSTA